MTKANADNLHLEVTNDGKVIREPQIIQYLRQNGYTIEEVVEAHTVPSDSDPELVHDVLLIHTYEWPTNHPKLDYEAHQIAVFTCDCWAYRSESPDISEPEVTPDMLPTCKHIKGISKVERAKDDNQQTTLLDQA